MNRKRKRQQVSLALQYRPHMGRLVAAGFRAGLSMHEIALATTIDRDVVECIIRSQMREFR